MCVLRATGTTFDVEAFLATSPLSPYKVTSPTGEQRRMTDSPIKDVPGFRVDVSRANWSDLGQQVKDALAFLDTHRAELARLRDYPGVERITLDFPIESRLGARVTAQFEHLSPELIAAAGALRIGIDLSIYPPLDRGGQP